MPVETGSFSLTDDGMSLIRHLNSKKPIQGGNKVYNMYKGGDAIPYPALSSTIGQLGLANDTVLYFAVEDDYKW